MGGGGTIQDWNRIVITFQLIAVVVVERSCQKKKERVGTGEMICVAVTYKSYSLGCVHRCSNKPLHKNTIRLFIHKDFRLALLSSFFFFFLFKCVNVLVVLAHLMSCRLNIYMKVKEEEENCTPLLLRLRLCVMDIWPCCIALRWAGRGCIGK